MDPPARLPSSSSIYGGGGGGGSTDSLVRTASSSSSTATSSSSFSAAGSSSMVTLRSGNGARQQSPLRKGTHNSSCRCSPPHASSSSSSSSSASHSPLHHHHPHYPPHRWRTKIRFQWLLQLLLIGGVLPSLLTLRNMGVLNSTTTTMMNTPTTITTTAQAGGSLRNGGLRGPWEEEEEDQQGEPMMSSGEGHDDAGGNGPNGGPSEEEDQEDEGEPAVVASSGEEDNDDAEAAVAAATVPTPPSSLTGTTSRVTIPKVRVIAAAASNNKEGTDKQAPRVSSTLTAAVAAAASSSNTNKKWHNDKGLVHVVLTRFMQHQPNLLHLGRARLELFRTFCLPTLVQQTNHQFLWIIRVDPDLRSELKTELLLMLQTPAVQQSGLNFIVVGSNARIDSGHFRTIKASNDITAQTVWDGNHALFRDYFHAAQDHIVVETGLDADDGLALSYVEALQTQAIQAATYNAQHRIPKWWRVYCVSSSDEWQYYGPYWNSTLGSLRHSADAATRCLTPGLSRVSTPHYRRYKEVIGKYEGKNTTYEDLKLDGTGFFVDHFFVKNRLKKCGTRGRHSHCYAAVPPAGYVQALRARTPTSAGMKDVEATDAIDSDPGRDLTTAELAHWHRVSTTFGVSIDSVQAARGRMHAILPHILSDALSGQCTEGHTCKDSAKGLLLQLLNASSVA